MSEIGNLRIEWLEAFVAVADHGKRTAAGQQIGRDQATVTKFVQKLEFWFRAPLIESGSAPARLTPAGQQFIGIAREVVQRLGDARPARPNASSPPAPRISGADIEID